MRIITAVAICFALLSCEPSGSDRAILEAKLAQQEKQIKDLAGQLKKGGGSAAPSTELSLKNIQLMSAAGLTQADISSDSLVALLRMYKLRELERCIVKFRHWAYVEGKYVFSSNETYERQGFMLLLGCRDGQVIGLTKLCSADILKGIEYDDPGWQEYLQKGEKVPIYAGVIALEVPGVARRDYYIVDHETPTIRPAEEFKSTFFEKMQIRPEFWPKLAESGDYVRIKRLEKNDLAFVIFEKRRFLGIAWDETKDGLHVTVVGPRTPAFRAGIEIGDDLVSINGKPVRNNSEFASALVSCPFNQAVRLQVRHLGSLDTLYTVFVDTGNFVTEGKVANLGLKEPEKVLDALLAELDKLGSLLRDEFHVECRWCEARRQAAPLAQPPGPLDYVSIATAVVGVGPFVEIANKIEHTVDLMQKFERFYEIGCALKRDVEAFKDLHQYMKEKFALGKPLVFDPQTVTVLSGDSFEALDSQNVKHRIRLAYIMAKGDQSKQFLSQLLVTASAQGLSLVAGPDGEDRQGFMHAHVFLVKEGERLKVDDFESLIASAPVYCNMLVMLGGGNEVVVSDDNVSTRATGFILAGLRRVQELRGK